MAETLRLTRYELERTCTLPRMLLVLGILVAGVHSSLMCMDMAAAQQASEGAQTLAGATVFDAFYIALNVEAGWLLPVACIVLCGDLISRDAGEGSRLLIALRLVKRSSYVKAKVLTALILCFGCVVGLFALSVAMSALQRGLPLGNGSVPEWLATKGPEYTVHDNWGLIPESWSYPAVLLGLIAAFTVIEAAIALLVMALSVRCRTRFAPIVAGCLAVVLLNMLGDIATSIALVLNPRSALSMVGWVTDRFSLANYRLGAGFFQTQAGQRAGEVVTVDGATGYTDWTFPINSFAQLTAIVLAMLSISYAALYAELRNAGLPITRRRAKHARG